MQTQSKDGKQKQQHVNVLIVIIDPYCAFVYKVQTEQVADQPTDRCQWLYAGFHDQDIPCELSPYARDDYKHEDTLESDDPAWLTDYSSM